MVTIILIMVGAGVLGATVNLALASESRTRTMWTWNIVAGVGAALLTPLFLRTVSSSLVSDMLRSAPSLEDFLVFGGFCLIAAISARRFIGTLSDRVLREAQQAQRDAADAKRGMADLADQTNQATATALAATDAARYGTHAGSPGVGLAQPWPTVEPGPAPDDPWAGQFGGKSEVEGRTLEATLQPVAARPGWMIVSLRVHSTDPRRPLTGDVQFYLHPTFTESKPIVRTEDGEAALTVLSWGAFTVGALADDGKVRLELDLAKHPDAKEPWRSR